MSSRVVVVTNACGRAGDPAHEVGAPLRVELAEHVVEEQERGAAVERRQQVELGQLEREDRGPLLPARRERGERPAAHLEHEVVAMGPDERCPVPDLLLGGLREAAGEGVTRRLAGRAAGRWSRR